MYLKLTASARLPASCLYYTGRFVELQFNILGTLDRLVNTTPPYIRYTRQAGKHYTNHILGTLDGLVNTTPTIY